MRELLFKIFTSVTFVIILKWRFAATDRYCKESYDKDVGVIANCSHQGSGLTDVPQDLNESIVVLDLSYNRIHFIIRDSFARYVLLKKLVMMHMKKAFEFIKEVFQKDTFAGLINLEYIDISGSYTSQNLYLILQWPPKLKKMILSENKDMRNVKVDHLEYLEEFYCNSCQFYGFPEFYVEAPLYIVELMDNPMEILYVMDIAPFCRLRHLGLKCPDGLYLHMERNYCECIRLKRWLLRHTIWSYPLNCTSPAEHDSQFSACDSWFYTPELEARRTCQARIIQVENLTPTFYITIGGIIVGVIVLVMLSAIVYAIRRRRRLGSELGEASASDEAVSEENLEEELE